jgi:hypothetical protein
MRHGIWAFRNCVRLDQPLKRAPLRYGSPDQVRYLAWRAGSGLDDSSGCIERFYIPTPTSKRCLRFHAAWIESSRPRLQEWAIDSALNYKQALDLLCHEKSAKYLRFELAWDSSDH